MCSECKKLSGCEWFRDASAPHDMLREGFELNLDAAACRFWVIHAAKCIMEHASFPIKAQCQKRCFWRPFWPGFAFQLMCCACGAETSQLVFQGKGTHLVTWDVKPSSPCWTSFFFLGVWAGLLSRRSYEDFKQTWKLRCKGQKQALSSQLLEFSHW